MQERTQKKNKARSRVVISRANQLTTEPRVMKIARSLESGGYQVTLVGWNMDGDLPDFEQLEGFDCHRLPVRVRFGRGLVNLVHQLRWQLALMVWLTSQRRNYTIIHACDFDTVLPAILCKLIYRKKVVYDIFDDYAEMLRATPGLVKQLIRGVDRFVINAVDLLILADEARYEQISGAHPKCSLVIYNALEDMPRAVETNRNEAAVNPWKLRLAYFGNLQVERGLVELLDVIEKHPDWRLDLGGFGGDTSLIQSRASNITNVSWHGLVPYRQVIDHSAVADLLIATYDPKIPNNRYASPNKLFEAMMLGKPIIVARGTNMDRIVLENDCGLVVTYGSRKDLESTLLRLQEHPELRKQLGINARKAYEMTYNWPRMQERLLTSYADLGNS